MSSTKITMHDIDESVKDALSPKDHIENKENPHGVTAEQIGAAEEDHTHDICLIKHDTTGALYRIGLDDTGLYCVPYSL